MCVNETRKQALQPSANGKGKGLVRRKGKVIEALADYRKFAQDNGYVEASLRAAIMLEFIEGGPWRHLGDFLQR